MSNTHIGVTEEIVFNKTDKNTYQVELTEEQFLGIERSVKRHQKQLDGKIRYENRKRDMIYGKEGVKSRAVGSKLPRYVFIVQDNNKMKYPKIYEPKTLEDKLKLIKELIE